MQGRYEEAKQCCLAALRMYSKLEGEDSFTVASISSGLGTVYRHMGRFDKSLTHL